MLNKTRIPKEDTNSLLKSVGTLSYGSISSELPVSVDSSISPQVDHPRSPRQRVWTVFVSSVVVSLPALLGGCTLGFSSSALLDLTELEPRQEYKFNTALADIFGALGPIGALLIAPIAGWMADLIGRKASLVLTGVPFLLGYLVMVYARFLSNALNFKIVVLVGRFFTGVGLGWSCISTPIYLAEISSNNLRGVFTSFTEVFMVVGVLLIYSLGSFTTFPYYNSSLVLSGIVAVFELSMVFLYETPRWLLAHNHKKKAIKALKFLRGAKYDIATELKVIETEITVYPKLTFTQALRELGRRKVFTPFLIVCSVVCLQQLSGAELTDAYSALIFKEANVADYRGTATYAVGAVSVVFTIIGAFIVDCIGRKILLLVSGAGMLISTVTLGTYFYVTRPELCTNTTLDVLGDSNDVVCRANLSPIAIASMIIFSVSFSIGWGPVPWILVEELLPLRVRGVGSGIVTLVDWTVSALVTGFYLNYAEAVHNWFAWWSFSAFNLIGIVFVALFVFETKGKNLEDIQHRFDSSHAKSISRLKINVT